MSPTEDRVAVEAMAGQQVELTQMSENDGHRDPLYLISLPFRVAQQTEPRCLSRAPRGTR